MPIYFQKNISGFQCNNMTYKKKYFIESAMKFLKHVKNKIQKIQVSKNLFIKFKWQSNVTTSSHQVSQLKHLGISKLIHLHLIVYTLSLVLELIKSNKRACFLRHDNFQCYAQLCLFLHS